MDCLVGDVSREVRAAGSIQPVAPPPPALLPDRRSESTTSTPALAGSPASASASAAAAAAAAGLAGLAGLAGPAASPKTPNGSRASPPRLPRFKTFSLQPPLRALKLPSARRASRKPVHPYRSVPASDGPDTYQMTVHRRPPVFGKGTAFVARRPRRAAAPAPAKEAAPADAPAPVRPPVARPAPVLVPTPVVVPTPAPLHHTVDVRAAAEALAAAVRAGPPAVAPVSVPAHRPSPPPAVASFVPVAAGARQPQHVFHQFRPPQPAAVRHPHAVQATVAAAAGGDASPASAPGTPVAVAAAAVSPAAAAAAAAAARASPGGRILPPKNSGTSDFNWLGQRKQCGSCGATKTPYWRDGRDNTCLCNACGIRYKKHRVACRGCEYVPRKRESSSGVCPRCDTPLVQ